MALITKICHYLTLVISVHSFQYQLFSDHLNKKHLNRALIMICDNDKIDYKRIYIDFLSNKYTTFYNIGHKDKKDMQKLVPLFNTGIGAYLNLNCRHSLEILKQAAKTELLNSSVFWILTSSSLESATKILNSVNINIASEIIVAISEDTNRFVLFDVFNTCFVCGAKVNVTEMGYWTRKHGIVTNDNFTLSKVVRRSNFNGVTIRASAAILALPKGLTLFEHLESLENRHLDLMHRKCYQIFKMVAEKLNFKMLITRTKGYGINTNGSWDGSIGEVVRRDAEFTISPLRLHTKRIGEFVYLPELYTASIAFIFRHPSRSVLRNMFLRPFDEKVWWGIFSLSVGLIFLLRAMGALNVDKARSSLSKEFLTICGTVFQQGFEDNYPLMSSRTALFTTLLFGLILFQFYSAFVVGSLLTEAPRTITSVDKLFNSKLQIGMDDIVYNHEFFKLTSKEAKRLFDWKISKNVLPFNEGIRKIKRGGFAFHVESSTAYRVLEDVLTESEICDLQEVLFFSKFQASPGIAKRSPYREFFANIILRIREFGLLEYETKQWQVEKPPCSLKNMVRQVPIDFEQFLPAIIALSFGMLISVIILIIEIICMKVTSARINAKKRNHPKNILYK